ncbi:MAG: alanine racemase [Bacilli bacterium]|nr:alanine racemase [Bacilli bacterium]
MKTTERVIAYVDLDQLATNYRLLKDRIGDTCQFMAVVKADAYGHGSVQIAKKLESLGVAHYGVASVQEAVELREAGLKGEILIFGRTPIEDAGVIEANDLTVTVASAKEVQTMLDHAKNVKCHINVDTGMSRYGIYCQDYDFVSETLEEIKNIHKLSGCTINGIYTHFANAVHRKEKFTEMQFSIFSELLDRLDASGLKIPSKHCANSSATLLSAKMHLDMVRVGIALYGLAQVPTELDLKPVMTLKAKVADIRLLNKNDTISYGRIYKVKRPMRIATLPYGYADGYPRLLSNKDYVLFESNELPVLGRICMDACMIDALDTDINVGDEVEIFGKIKTAGMIAKKVDTIAYEILTSVGKRVSRIYVSNS